MILPDDLNLLITEYLDTDTYSINFLEFVGCSLNKYSSKNFYDFSELDRYKFIIKKIKNYYPKKSNMLLTKITHLFFDYEFNQSVDNLPPNITYLTFGSNFNQPVDYLPKTLTHLTFGYDFNQPVDYLPPNITDLTFGISFNQSVNNLPPNITDLTF